MINDKTHVRFWVTLPRDKFDLLAKDAQELNLSCNAFSGQIITEHLNRKHEVASEHKEEKRITPQMISETINEALSNLDYGTSFTVKDMFKDSEWKLMTRSEKGVAARILSAKVKAEKQLVIDGSINKASIYRKVKENTKEEKK